MNPNTSFQSGDEILDVRDLQKWNCIIEPTVHGQKSYGGLYLGDVDCAQDPYLLQKLKIGALLSVIDEPQIVLPECMNYIVRETIAIPDCASESLIYFFPRCSGFMESQRAHTNVMVHCFAGISRSASVVIAYLMEKFEWSYERTLGTVKAVRKQVKPNPGFAQQLQQYEVHLKHKQIQKLQSKQIPSKQTHMKTQTSVQRDLTPTKRINKQEQKGIRYKSSHIVSRAVSSGKKQFQNTQDSFLGQSVLNDQKPTAIAVNQRQTTIPNKRTQTDQKLDINKSSVQKILSQMDHPFVEQDYSHSDQKKNNVVEIRLSAIAQIGKKYTNLNKQNQSEVVESLKMNPNTQFQSGDEILDVRDLQKWNCIIEPTVHGQKSYGGLYLGDVDCAQDPYLLQKLKIGALLSVIDEPQIVLPECMNYIVRETIAIPDCASESLIYFFPRCSGFMESQRAHTNVMVHCFAGISRSASVVIAYLMEKFEWSYERTLGTVKAVRKQVKPNHGFVQQLQQYEVHLKHKSIQQLQPKRAPSQTNQAKTQTQVQRDVTPTQRINIKDQQIHRTESSGNKQFQRTQDSFLYQSFQEDKKPILSAIHQRYTTSPQKRAITNQMLDINKSSILQVINNQTNNQGRERDFTQRSNLNSIKSVSKNNINQIRPTVIALVGQKSTSLNKQNPLVVPMNQIYPNQSNYPISYPVLKQLNQMPYFIRNL